MLTWCREDDPRLPGWLNRVLNTPPFLLPAEWIVPVIAVALGFTRSGQWVPGKIGRGPNPQMFWNGILYFRFMLPFCVCLMVRWSGSTTDKAYLQLMTGWKLNGRITPLTLRIQSDTSASAGVLSPNTDQSAGWAEGGK